MTKTGLKVLHSDLQNIVVHVMEDEVREHYDLESLWALGEKFDPKLNFDYVDLDLIKELLPDEAQHQQETNFDDIFKNRWSRTKRGRIEKKTNVVFILDKKWH